MTIIVFTVTAIATSFFMPYIKDMLEASGALRKNFQGQIIPTGMGIVFMPAVLLGSIVLVFMKEADIRVVLLNVLGITAMGFVGIVDDLLGDKHIKGFRGHISCLFGGKLSTGGLKAIVGCLTAAALSVVISLDFFEGTLNFLLIAMFTNLLNLLDLRPGRAIKSFFLVWGISYILVSTRDYGYVLLPLAGSLAAYLPMDISCKGMMGDAGSNALGIALGLYYCLSTQLYQKAGIFVVLVLLHLASEKYSFTKVIYRNRILRYIDGLGTGGVGRFDD